MLKYHLAHVSAISSDLEATRRLGMLSFDSFLYRTSYEAGFVQGIDNYLPYCLENDRAYNSYEMELPTSINTSDQYKIYQMFYSWCLPVLTRDSEAYLTVIKRDNFIYYGILKMIRVPDDNMDDILSIIDLSDRELDCDRHEWSDTDW